MRSTLAAGAAYTTTDLQVSYARTAARRAPVHLWAKDHHGGYRTRGRNSVGTGRAAKWETIETSSGTRTVVKQGKVSVRDLHRHKSVHGAGGSQLPGQAPSRNLIASASCAGGRRSLKPEGGH